MEPVGLVIFDCDGVLVDSEPLSAEVLMQMMAEIGLPISIEIFQSDFLGRSFATAARQVEERLGHSMPPGFQEQYRSRLLEQMRGQLKAMAGVELVLDRMKVPFCLATSSSPSRLAVSLAETGLESYFAGRAYTASMVAHGKPAPDLLFHVAQQMTVPPELCLVIEDSAIGIEAAQNAGMCVWHFRGGGHFRSGYQLPAEAAPQRVLDSMQKLREAFIEIGVCGE